MPVRPCLGCSVLIGSGSWCPACEPPRPSRRTPGRGGGARASRFRAAVLRAAGWRCEVVEAGERCQVTGAGRLEAHHVHAIPDGGDADDPANGRAVCRRHHRMLDAARVSDQG